MKPMIMRDSVNASAIPADTPIVAGYADGRYAWSVADRARFPTAVRLTIATRAGSSADILDVENGDATPDQVPGWCDAFSRSGRRAPTIYCSRASWPAVQAAVGARRVDYWISTLDGTKDVPGAVAVQYIDTGAYDESVILDPSWVAPEETPMTTQERVDIARALTRLTYATAAHRTPESQAAEDQLVGRAVGDPVNGFDYMVRDLLLEPEFAGDQAEQATELRESSLSTQETPGSPETAQ